MLLTSCRVPQLFAALILSANLAHAEGPGTSMTIDQAIETALEQSRRGEISRQALEYAEAQYAQAQSIYRPTVNLLGYLQRRDEPVSFTYPALAFQIATPIGPVPVSTPEQKVDAIGKVAGSLGIEAKLPLYTGGLRKNILKQADIGRGIAREQIRRTDADIIFDVRRYYLGAMLARLQSEVVSETVLDLQTIEKITAAFFEGGSTRVDRTDVLQSRLSATMAKGIAAQLDGGHETAITALTHGTGMQWSDRVVTSGDDFPSPEISGNLAALVSDARKFNPEMATLRLAVDVADAEVGKARSKRRPKVALTGSVMRIDSDLDGGLANGANRNSWSVGVVLSMPLMDGGLAKNSIAAARAGRRKQETQMLQVESEIAARIRAMVIEADRAQTAIEISQSSAATATELHDLIQRAYQQGARDLEDLLNAQFMKTLNAMSLVQARHDYAVAQSALERLIGKAVSEQGM